MAYFSEVLRALIDVRAPLDLTGMTSDFLADECSHVELASRLAMELGGAVPRELDHRPLRAAAQWADAARARERLVLRVSCIAEAFSGGTAAVSHASTSHPLPTPSTRPSCATRRTPPPRWAVLRMGALSHRRRRARAPRSHAAPGLRTWPRSGRTHTRRRSRGRRADEARSRALGWLRTAKFAGVAREVVVRDILDPLETIGIGIARQERAELLA